jgi:hypothetical protein
MFLVVPNKIRGLKIYCFISHRIGETANAAAL